MQYRIANLSAESVQCYWERITFYLEVEFLIVMKILLLAPQQDGHLVSKTVNEGPLYWHRQYFIQAYGQFVEVGLVQFVLI